MDEITNEVQMQPQVQQAPPVKTGGDKAMGIISKLLIIFAFVIAAVSLMSILVLVVSYNLEFGFKVLNMTELAKLKTVAPIYKTYALYLGCAAVGAMLLTIPAKILNGIQKRKGFPSKLVKVFFIITMILAGVTILNCALNYFLFGQYEIIYL